MTSSQSASLHDERDGASARAPEPDERDAVAAFETEAAAAADAADATDAETALAARESQASAAPSDTLAERIGALLFVAAGVGVVALAVSRNRTALTVMDPGTLGSITAIVTGLVFAAIHGLRFALLVALMVPLLAGQYYAAIATRRSFLPAVGVELLALGVIGVVAHGARARARAAETEAEPDADAPAGETS